jgi:hypothetical protein
LSTHRRGLTPAFKCVSRDSKENEAWIGTVIIIEDKENFRSELKKNLKNRLKETKIVTIDGEGDSQDSKTYETQLEEIFEKVAPHGAFIISDKDLSNLGRRFRGLSGTTVATVADTMGFPLCLYARGEGKPHGEEFLKSLAPWEKKRIIIDPTPEKDIAKQCANIFRAFDQIEKSYQDLLEEERATPAAALSKILKQPGIEDRIALYGSGEQGLLQEIMPFQKKNDPDGTKSELTKRMPRILGNWLYTSILRFPGILVNEVAAASYLNISQEDYSNPAVKKLFSKAKYKGPFSGLADWWWRHELDNIIFVEDCEDGLDYVKFKEIDDEVKPCDDPITKKRAGYYCMVTEQPVSDENSKGDISWFPSGADLARIRLDKFNELAPWIGLY